MKVRVLMQRDFSARDSAFCFPDRALRFRGELLRLIAPPPTCYRLVMVELMHPVRLTKLNPLARNSASGNICLENFF
jgi:hypothetical protein